MACHMKKRQKMMMTLMRRAIIASHESGFLNSKNPNITKNSLNVGDIAMEWPQVPQHSCPPLSPQKNKLKTTLRSNSKTES
jgi:hypothetical protein